MERFSCTLMKIIGAGAELCQGVGRKWRCPLPNNALCFLMEQMPFEPLFPVPRIGAGKFAFGFIQPRACFGDMAEPMMRQGQKQMIPSRAGLAVSRDGFLKPRCRLLQMARAVQCSAQRIQVEIIARLPEHRSLGQTDRVGTFIRGIWCKYANPRRGICDLSVLSAAIAIQQVRADLP